MTIFLIIIVILIVLCIFGYIHIRNGFIQDSNDIDGSWSQIDVQLQRRNDLIPNLVSTVKGYAGYERSTLTNVIKMRGQMVHIDASKGTTTEQQKQQMMNLSNQLAQTMKSIFAVSERYPDLQANSDFKDLMSTLENTEDRIAYARQLYNSTIKVYNNAIMQFPGSLVAGSKFQKRNYLQTPKATKQNPKVDFSDLNNNR